MSTEPYPGMLWTENEVWAILDDIEEGVQATLADAAADRIQIDPAEVQWDYAKLVLSEAENQNAAKEAAARLGLEGIQW